jgi:hypothetical protein
VILVGELSNSGGSRTCFLGKVETVTTMIVGKEVAVEVAVATKVVDTVVVTAGVAAGVVAVAAAAGGVAATAATVATEATVVAGVAVVVGVVGLVGVEMLDGVRSNSATAACTAEAQRSLLTAFWAIFGLLATKINFWRKESALKLLLFSLASFRLGLGVARNKVFPMSSSR